MSFKVRSFGRDCLGNISGYVVERYVWVPREWSKRKDGTCLEIEVAGTFVGNIYEAGSFDRAKADAQALCDRLNRS